MSNRSWAMEVIADSSGKWCGNGIRLATKQEAEDYARDLSYRWLLVTDRRVIESEDPVNYKWTRENGLVAMEQEREVK